MEENKPDPKSSLQNSDKDRRNPSNDGTSIQDLPLPASENINKVTVLVGLGVLITILLIIYALGSHFNWWLLVSRRISYADSVELISFNTPSTNLEILMLVRRNNRSEIRSLNANTRAENFFSNLNLDSFAPVSSPVGDGRVAYFIRDTANKLAIIVAESGPVITETVTVKTLEEVNYTGHEICDYSKIVWSPNGEQIATFICNPETKESHLLVTKIGKDNLVFNKTKDNLSRIRTLAWADNEQVAFTKTENGLDVVYLINISDVNNSLERLFGP